MKILWLCNTLLPHIAEKLHISIAKPESWIAGLYSQIQNVDGLSLYYLFPTKYGGECLHYGSSVFIGYAQHNPEKLEKAQVEQFKKVLNDYRPDIIHIFGTEYPHSYAMLEACHQLNLLDQLLISIQGMVSICAKHYYGFLPQKCLHRYTLRDFLRHDNLYWQKRKFERRGLYEVKALQRAKHVVGRTDWDYACTKRLNPNVQYHFCNETLRPVFYQNAWLLENCERYSIFASQCSYPIKGFHLLLEAMVDVVKQYPDAHLYTTGKHPLSLTGVEKIRQTYYNKYLCKLIKKYHLEKHVTFLGTLDEQQMCTRYLKSHVFVSSSSIENSPNSVGEAMILGVPVVTSDVGGVKNLLEHGKEGYIYPADEPYMLAYYVMRIFENDELTLSISKNAQIHAKALYDKKTNLTRLLQIYSEICG